MKYIKSLLKNFVMISMIITHRLHPSKRAPEDSFFFTCSYGRLACFGLCNSLKSPKLEALCVKSARNFIDCSESNQVFVQNLCMMRPPQFLTVDFPQKRSWLVRSTMCGRKLTPTTPKRWIDKTKSVDLELFTCCYIDCWLYCGGKTGCLIWFVRKDTFGRLCRWNTASTNIN